MEATQHKRFVRRQVEAYEESWKEDHEAVQLRGIQQDIGSKLASWQPPRLSSAVGLREITLTPEAAEELDKIIARGPSKQPDQSFPKMQEAPREMVERWLRGK